jgi:respiratory burst oxidase
VDYLDIILFQKERERKQNKTRQDKTARQDKMITSASNTSSDKWSRWEAYFFNEGANISFLVLLVSFNIAMATWGAWEFTEPHWETPNDILRVTLPIARASGRLVTWNTGLILMSGCKHWWTLLRSTPLAYGFPIDNIMPYYHKVIAYTIIVMGCIVHTIPQIVNYATETLPILHNGLIWTDRDDDTIPTGQLFYTGLLLVFFFSLFFITTLEQVRRTSLGFRIFWWTHVISICAVMPLLIIHGTIRGTPFTIWFLTLPLILYGIDVVWRRCKTPVHAARVLELRAMEEGDEQVTKIVLQSEDFVYSAGQYAELKIPSLSSSEWHPFTIASRPNIKEGATVTFYIKAAGRWTNALFDLAKEKGKQNSPIDVDISVRGPFGAPAQNYFSYKHVIVIGSGIGVTPLLSVWQHLVASLPGANSDRTLVVDDLDDSSELYEDISATKKKMDDQEEEALLEQVNIDNIDVVAMSLKAWKTGKGQMAYAAASLESMTVNILLFCASFFGLTVVFCVWIYELDREAAALQIQLNLFTLSVFSTKAILATVVYGKRYLVSFVFRLEALILATDALSLWSSVESVREPSREMAILYFTFFAAFIFLHGIRIFHIFYATARPAEIKNQNETNKAEQKAIQSITGVWVSRSYAGMSYALQDLVASLQGIPSAFSLKLYATREKEELLKKSNSLFRGSLSKQHSLTAGRPDWEQIMREALTRAHNQSHNKEGDSVGVFFCGSPAIARTLQRTAQQITAEHQYMHGAGKCNCRVLLHKENF